MTVPENINKPTLGGNLLEILSKPKTNLGGYGYFLKQRICFESKNDIDM